MRILSCEGQVTRPQGSLHLSMSESIKSGQHYNITNEENGLAFYLYLDDKAVVGWGFRDEERQRVSRLSTSILAHPSYNFPVDHREAGR